MKKLSNHKYLIAWIDALSKNESTGRAVIFTGYHSEEGDLVFSEKLKITIPKIFPGFLLNKYIIISFKIINIIIKLYFINIYKFWKIIIIKFKLFFL